MVTYKKSLYTFYQYQGVINNDYHQTFLAYIKIIEFYGGAIPVHPGLFSSNMTIMESNDPIN